MSCKGCKDKDVKAIAAAGARMAQHAARKGKVVELVPIKVPTKKGE